MEALLICRQPETSLSASTRAKELYFILITVILVIITLILIIRDF